MLPVLMVHSVGLSGIHGILAGHVRDQKTGDPLPGVNVVIVDGERGTTTDVEGYYQMQNIRAGLYQIRVSLVGYTSQMIKNVIINPDLRTRLDVELAPTAISLDEVTVVHEKPLIQKDVTGTTFIVSGREIETLPVDDVTGVLRLKPGVTLEGNVRGGKSSEVLYLVDGLPLQDVVGGGAAGTLPNSSIFGAGFYLGGLDAEYGNALSGVVNVITRTGTDVHAFFTRADKDNLFGGTQNSRSTEVEASATGPLMIGRMYYAGAFNGQVSDTRWWQDFRHFFGSPIDRQLSGFAKVDYLFEPTLRLGVQGLVSVHDWHDYEYDWRFNLDGIPPQHRAAGRLAAIVSHSLSETFFYTASLSIFGLSSRIGKRSKENIPVNDPYQYDFFLRYVVDGQRAWRSEHDQLTYTAKIDGTMKAGADHLFKMGGELNLFDLDADIVKYEPRKTYFGKPLVNEPQLNFSTAYHYTPKSGSLYIQDKIDLSRDGILLNVGLRYDFLEPNATRPAIERIPVSDTSFAVVQRGEERASWKGQLSPRFGAAMQLSERAYFFVNLGWYFQHPLFEYLYTGLDRVALGRGVSALTGNPNLDPERVMAYELTVKYDIGRDVVLSVGYFRKEAQNLVDSKTFVQGNSRVAGSFGFAEYVNTPAAESRGFEVILSRERNSWLLGELSYSYMTAEGTSGSTSDGFFIAQYGLPPAIRIYPLSWDQRHTVKATATVVTPWGLTMTAHSDYHTGRPYTRYPTATGFEAVDSALFQPNNARMPRYLNVDVKARFDFPFGWPGSTLSAYLEVRNLLNGRNVRWIDSNGRIGGELGDPGGYYIGRRTTLGVQVAF